MLSMERRSTRMAVSSLALALLLNAALAQTAASDEPRSPAEVTDDDIPLLGLSSQYRLGLPAVEPDALYEFYPYPPGRRAWSAPWRFGPYRAAYRPRAYWDSPYWGWYPWDGAPQTIKRKNHGDSSGLATPPRLGLHYQYPDAYELGLRIPEGVIDDVASEPDYAAFSPVVAEGLALLKKKRYVEAARVLSTEIKDGAATLETYMAVSEVLAANGKYSAASRVLLHGLQLSADLRVLDAMAIRQHFPSPEALETALREIDDAITKSADPARARLVLLRATFLLLGGDPRAMDMLEELHLSTSKPVADSARRLYLHFVDRLLDEDGEKPEEASPVPPKEGEDEGRKDSTDAAKTGEI